MTEGEVLRVFAELWPADWVRTSPWLFGLLETLHFIGLSLLLGALLVVDLAYLGALPGVSPRSAARFLLLGIVGFALNAATGWAFFVSDPPTYWFNPAFKAKLMTIALAGSNAAAFAILERRRVALAGRDGPVGPTARAAAALSLVLWAAVAAWGRLLPSFEGAAGLFD